MTDSENKGTNTNQRLKNPITFHFTETTYPTPAGILGPNTKRGQILSLGSEMRAPWSSSVVDHRVPINQSAQSSTQMSKSDLKENTNDDSNNNKKDREQVSVHPTTHPITPDHRTLHYEDKEQQHFYKNAEQSERRETTTIIEKTEPFEATTFSPTQIGMIMDRLRCM